MTAAPSIVYPSMDLLHPEDTMDLASSPRMPTDDFDLPYELDAMRDASVEPFQEAMVEDPINPDQNYEDVQLIDEDLLDDDEMVDEDTVVLNAATQQDFAMESHHQTHDEHEDDDILYDDEPVHESLDDARGPQDVEIADEEDLFGNDAEATNDPLEDTPRTKQALPTDKLDEILDEQSTNMITQDAEDSEHTQGPLPPGDFADNMNDHIAEDPATFRDDFGNNPDHKGSTIPSITGERMTNESPTVRVEATNNAQPLDLPDPVNANPAGLPTPEAADSASQFSILQIPSHEGELAGNSDILPTMNGTEDQDGHSVDHQTQPAPLHTVKVNYLDTEICLFPPNEDDESETFFLTDVDLANQSLDKLLSACHDVLAGTIGDNDELVLDIPSLGLHISQDSSYACQMTLSQVLDVYLALSHNEQAEVVEPLYCHLTSRVSLASQHAYLRSAAEQGRTFAEIAAEYLSSYDSPDEGDQVDDFTGDSGADHKDLEQDQVLQSENLEHHDADFENTKVEAQDNPNYHTGEGGTAEDLFANEEESNLGSQESRPERDRVDDTGNAEIGTSATSTLRGDEAEPQDIETSNHDIAESADTASMVGHYTEGTVDVVALHDSTVEDEDSDTETPSAVGDTESSRTIEASDDAYGQTPSANADAGRETLSDNHSNLHGTTDTLASGDLAEESYAQDHVNDYNDPLNDHSEHELHESFQEAAALDSANGHVRNEPAPRVDGHEDLFEYAPSKETAPDGKAEQDGGQSGVDEDEFLLSDDDAKDPAHEATSPATPSKAKTSKRKSRDEEDDFGLLESRTPDFKRRRPS